MKLDKKWEELKENLIKTQKEYDKAQKKFARSRAGKEMTIAGAEWSVAGSKLSEATRLCAEYNNKMNHFSCDYDCDSYSTSFSKYGKVNHHIVNISNNTTNGKTIVSTSVSNDNNCNNGHCVRTKTTTITYSDGTKKTIIENN